jgi:hypothetical protein
MEAVAAIEALGAIVGARYATGPGPDQEPFLTDGLPP